VSRLLFGETVAVYCENHTGHINTLYGLLKRVVNILTVGL
jgi:hypothetical protein